MQWFQPQRAKESFMDDVLSGVSLPRRLRLLRLISEDLGIDEADELNTAIRRAYDTRNQMAHVAVSAHPSDPLQVLFGRGRQPLTQEQLHDKLMELVGASRVIVKRLTDAMPDDEPPSATDEL